MCYLMCGYSIGTNLNLPTRFLLLGCDHFIPLHSELMTPEAIESFLCTEALEWAGCRGNRRTYIQSLQVSKLRYAELLADHGYTNLAREYVVSIRQLTGIGLDENGDSQAPPMSGNLVPVFPDNFKDRLLRFEDRLCGADLSCKREESEQRKSTIAEENKPFDEPPFEGETSNEAFGESGNSLVRMKIPNLFLHGN